MDHRGHVLPSEGEQRGLRALSASLDALAEGAERDPDAAWGKTREVLEWLHFCDEAAADRLTPLRYYALRAASADGQAQAGLMLARGLVHHNHAAEVQDLIWKPTETLVMVDGAWKPMMTSVMVDGEWKPMVSSVAVRAWPRLDLLPRLPPGQKTHGRDVHYSQHVEGRALMDPLLAAQRFLVALP